MYEPKFYRNWQGNDDLTTFDVRVEETDLFIRAGKDLRKKALPLVLKYRKVIEEYIRREPEFLTSIVPLKHVCPRPPSIIKDMLRSSQAAGVGPMAAVAGAIAEAVGRELLKFTDEIIVENGGDIFLKIKKPRTIGIYAGKSALSGKIGIVVRPGQTPLGVCTSSGRVGHSLSFGRADAVVVMSRSAALADAVATACANLVRRESDVKPAIEFVKKIRGVTGAAAIKNDKIAAWGDIKFCELNF
ncbi:MAG: UPF0280 family protein [Elusimicrobiota bacterium]